jgi:predicted CopG family antitoxin
MKNIMIREGIYGTLKEMKGKGSFSDILEELAKKSVETRRSRLRGYFGKLGDREAKEMEKSIAEVLRVAKGRLF